MSGMMRRIAKMGNTIRYGICGVLMFGPLMFYMVSIATVEDPWAKWYSRPLAAVFARFWLVLMLLIDLIIFPEDSKGLFAADDD